MRIMNAAEVAASLPWPALVEALRVMFARGCAAPLRHRHLVGDDATLLLMPAWEVGRYTGVKVVHVAPANRAAAVSALYLLSDAVTGVPVALLDGGALTDRRTAAASVLAAGYLARPDSSRLLLMGSGKVAHALGEAYRAMFPITEIAVWSRDGARAAALAGKLGGRAVAAPAFSAFDIIACATLAQAPLVRGADLAPGTHLDLVGAYRRDMREADAAALARSRLVVDTRVGAFAEAGDVVQAMAEGAFGEDHVVAELAELCRGEATGRGDAAEVTVFKSVGWAGEDLAAAILAVEVAWGK